MSTAGAASIVAQNNDGTGLAGTLFSRDSLVPLRKAGHCNGDQRKAAPCDGEQSLLPLITQALAPLLEQLQANNTAIKRMEQSIASLTEERMSGCLERVADDIRLQIDGLRATQEMAWNNIRRQKQLSEEENPVPFESTSKTGTLAVSAAAVVHLPQQQQQIQQKQEMTTDDQEPQWADILERAKTSETLRKRSRRKRTQHKRLTLTNSNARNLQMDVTFLTDHASIGIVRAFFRQVGRILDWWSSLEEPQRSGPLFEFMHSRRFDVVVACVIIANSVTMTHAANHKMQTLDTGLFVYAEWCFIAIYLFELLAKLAVHGGWLFYTEDALWNFFDSVLVVSSLYGGIQEFMDMFGSSSHVQAKPSTGLLNLRILRLLRVFRVLKLLRVFSPIWLIVNSVFTSFLSLFWSLLTLLFTHYLFALLMVQDLIVFREKNQGHVELDLEEAILDNFGSVWKAMLSLFKSISTGEVWNTYLQILPTFSSILLVFFVSLWQIQLVNILAAIFFQNTEKARNPDALTQANIDRHQLQKETQELQQLFSLIDHDNSGRISARELKETVEEDDEIKLQFHALGLEMDDSEQFFDLLVEHLPNGYKSDDVEIDRFVEGCMRMKGTAKKVTQETLLMETRALRRSQAEHHLCMKNWQTELHKKLEDILRARF